MKITSRGPQQSLARKEQAELIVIEELKSMRSFFLIANMLLIIAFVIYGLFVRGGFDYTVLTGMLLGNIAAVLNFYLIGYTAGKAIRRRDKRMARRYFHFSYAARTLTIFGVFGLLITLKVINPVAAVVPLLYPSSYYKLKAIFNKTV